MTIAAGSAALAADMLVTMTAAGDSAPSTSVAWTGDISPSQITGNQDNYNPTGLSTASTLRLSTDASRNITGLAGGADGRLIIIHNVGSFNIVLKDETTSTAANRFALSADITLAPDNVCALQYDSTTSRWRAIASPTDLSAATAHIAASTAVHGLPASVNVLGNRNAAGEFVQRSTATGGGAGGGTTWGQSASASLTFPVAFSSAPIVIMSGQNAPVGTCSPHSITTTGFSFYFFGDVGGGVVSKTAGYVAIGA